MIIQGQRSIGGGPHGSRVMPDAAPEGAIASAPVGTPAQPTPSRRAIVGRALVLVGVLVFVFGVVLPRLIDYDAVRAALAALTPGQLAAARRHQRGRLRRQRRPVPESSCPGSPGRTQSGRTWPRARSSAPCPGRPTSPRGSSCTASGRSPPPSRAPGSSSRPCSRRSPTFALPLIADRRPCSSSGQPAESRALLLALIGLIVLVAGAVLLVAIVRSEEPRAEAGRLARPDGPAHLEAVPEDAANGHRRGHPGPSGALEGHAHAARPAAGSSQPWSPSSPGSSYSRSPSGASGSGRMSSRRRPCWRRWRSSGSCRSFPITPGGVGVTEVAYIGILTSVAGSGLTEQLTAAVMLFRIAQWFVPIPIGWVLLLVMRRGHLGELLGGPDKAPTPSSS